MGVIIMRNDFAEIHEREVGSNRGKLRQNIFLDDSDRKKYLQMIRTLKERYGYILHSHALMDYSCRWGCHLFPLEKYMHLSPVGAGAAESAEEY